MSEDCKQCGTMMWLLDSDGLCPACNGIGFDEDGEPLSSRQWQILYEVSLIKLGKLAQRCSDDL